MIQELPATFNNQVGMEESMFIDHRVAIEDYLADDAVIDHYSSQDKP